MWEIACARISEYTDFIYQNFLCCLFGMIIVCCVHLEGTAAWWWQQRESSTGHPTHQCWFVTVPVRIEPRIKIFIWTGTFDRISEIGFLKVKMTDHFRIENIRLDFCSGRNKEQEKLSLFYANIMHFTNIWMLAWFMLLSTDSARCFLTLIIA